MAFKKTTGEGLNFIDRLHKRIEHLEIEGKEMKSELKIFAEFADEVEARFDLELTAQFKDLILKRIN